MITITIIGYGNVGRVLGTLLLGTRHAINLNIVDPSDHLSGAFLDLKHAMGLQPSKKVYFNDMRRFEQSDYLFFAAGVPSEHGASRLTTVKANTRLVQSIFEGKSLKSSMRVIAITNPLDVITAALIKHTGLPTNQIVGTGTFLDSKRLEYYLAEGAKVDCGDVQALVLGEHGESFVPIFSQSSYQGKPILDSALFSDKIIEKAVYETHHAAFEIRKTEPGTSMAVAHCALRLMEVWMREVETHIPVSVFLDATHSNWLELNNPICITVPVFLSNKGVRFAHPPDLTADEYRGLKTSAATLKKFQTFLVE